MTDRQKQLCEAYIPTSRDVTLDWDEYYVLDTADRVQKVWISSIAPDYQTDRTVYEVRNNRGVIKPWAVNEYGYISKSYLYDNKEDCKQGTHNFIDWWEDLRELQREVD